MIMDMNLSKRAAAVLGGIVVLAVFTAANDAYIFSISAELKSLESVLKFLAPAFLSAAFVERAVVTSIRGKERLAIERSIANATSEDTPDEGYIGKLKHELDVKRSF
jgi:hypothetical protein